MEKTELRPQIFLIEDFLTAEACDKYIAMAEGKVFEEAQINVHGRQMMSKGIRNNDRLMIFDHDLAEDLFRIAEQFLLRNTKIISFRISMKCSEFINIRPDRGSKCTETEAISATNMKKVSTLSWFI